MALVWQPKTKRCSSICISTIVAVPQNLCSMQGYQTSKLHLSKPCPDMYVQTHTCVQTENVQQQLLKESLRKVPLLYLNCAKPEDITLLQPRYKFGINMSTTLDYCYYTSLTYCYDSLESLKGTSLNFSLQHPTLPCKSSVNTCQN